METELPQHPPPTLSFSRVRALLGTGLLALAGPRLTELHVCYFRPEDFNFTQNQIFSRFTGIPAQRSLLTGSCRQLLCLQLTTPLEHLTAA